MACNPSTSAATLHRLAAGPYPEIRAIVAGHRSTAVADLEQLAGDPDFEVRRQVARNPSTSAATLHRLAAGPYPEIRAIVAGHRSTAVPTSSSWPAILTSRSAGRWLATPGTPTDVLRVLAQDAEDVHEHNIHVAMEARMQLRRRAGP